MEQQSPSFFERANQWVRTSVTLRLITIGILVLLMLIPISMITGLIREREYRQEEVRHEVSETWGGMQTITGPVITVPYYSWNRVYNDDNTFRMVESKEYAHFLPEELNIDGRITPEKRKRGIYEVMLYNAALKLSGKFRKPSFDEWSVDPKDILWDEAFIELGIDDLRSLQEQVKILSGDTVLEFNPGISSNELSSYGISTPFPAGDSATTEIPFTIEVDLNGSTNLMFVPVGKVTNVHLESDWDSPKFTGAFVTDKNTIRKDGFTADWKVLHLNRPYPQEFTGAAQGMRESAFGVELIVPVEEYQKSMRSAKYAVLFIILTFMMFFFAQILNGVRIHPIQYLLVGFAICIFFTLLIALSEHIPFAWSYLIASIATISLIAFYVRSIFSGNRITVIITLILATLYLFIFTIIQLEDYSLLMGSIGLFIVLAVAMALSRKIDWYGLNTSKRS